MIGLNNNQMSVELFSNILFQYTVLVAITSIVSFDIGLELYSQVKHRLPISPSS
jgi:hypothetical protein